MLSDRLGSLRARECAMDLRIVLLVECPEPRPGAFSAVHLRLQISPKISQQLELVVAFTSSAQLRAPITQC